MGYKQIDQNMTFAEVSLLRSMEHNRSLKRLGKINQVINWSQVEEILMAHYTVGTSREGDDAYPPLMLLNRKLPLKEDHAKVEFSGIIGPGGSNEEGTFYGDTDHRDTQGG